MNKRFGFIEKERQHKKGATICKALRIDNEYLNSVEGGLT